MGQIKLQNFRKNLFALNLQIIPVLITQTMHLPF